MILLFAASLGFEPRSVLIQSQVGLPIPLTSNGGLSHCLNYTTDLYTRYDILRHDPRNDIRHI